MTRAGDQPAGETEEERRLQHDQELERPQGLGRLPREREHQGVVIAKSVTTLSAAR